ncbi:NAD(P)H-hydrate dehydratase [Opitutia bacterium ISCC 51]|nr:NAD(P)H-hydrate dehydratase [Opitutae bacterium ISCC 51]QXD27816.1 NAD(P)H-hydrate dehydratase [Opitutae bacterium ISCC 52]
MTLRDSGYLHPVLDCAESQAFEKDYFKGDEAEEWKAMNCAGAAIASQAQLDVQEVLGRRPIRRALILVGKGHNGGDALIATRHILASNTEAQADLVFPYGLGHLRPLVRRCLDQLQVAGGNRLRYLSLRAGDQGTIERQLSIFLGDEDFDLCVDGILGMQFRPPLRTPALELLRWTHSHEGIACRIAVDLPSGLGDEADQDAFRADFSYATGIAKSALFASANRSKVGRIRYLDIGFFDQSLEADRYVLSKAILSFQRSLRLSQTHKKTYGHVFLVGGSTTMPGAILMATQSALKSGVGLVTCFVPESIVAEAAGKIPEAMWVGLPEIPEHGGLALEGLGLIRQHAKRASGWIIGPGMGTHEETATLIEEVLALSDAPVLLDADGLRLGIVSLDWQGRSCVVSPHVGEFNRLLDRELNTPVSEMDVLKLASDTGCVVIMKGSPTLIAGEGLAVYSCAGGPVLARGGSGDILSGLVGGRIAIPNSDLLVSVAEGVAWQGAAADAMAQRQGQVAAKATDILSFL